jgi:NhaA family Na+:H+ antiporter
MTSSSEPHKLVLRRERRSRATRPVKPQSGEQNSLRLVHPLDETRDHVRGGDLTGRVVSVVQYGDFLCPYCRRLHAVLARLRNVTSETAAFAFRYFPNERAHPGAEFAAYAVEAAAQQGRFWDMHDRLFEAEPPLAAADIISMARELGLDMDRFARDLDSESVRARVHRDLEDGRGNGVSGTPALFIDGTRYDGAWDFYSILEGVRLPVAARVQRSARAFASLPASGGLVLVAAAVLAIVCANTWLAPYYQAFMSAPFGIGPPDSLLSMSVGEWFSEGLLAVFFLIV